MSITEEILPELTEEETAPEEETTPEEETVPEEETAPEEETVPEETPSKGWGVYFGLLHAHSDLSDGPVSVREIYERAEEAPGMDFFAVTDHSESLSQGDTASLTEDMTALSADWAAGKAAAAAATGRDFVGIYGFEMSWPGDKEIGHISTFRTPGFVSWQQPAYSGFSEGLENYCAALAQVPGAVSQFNHPGPEFGDFRGFSRYSAGADRVVQLLEVDFGPDARDYYTQALDYGWHVAPSCSGNTHGADWTGVKGRTAVLAESLTEAGICDALAACRAYATQDSDLQILLDRMGQRLSRSALGTQLCLSVQLTDPTDAIGKVEVIVNGGEAIASRETGENQAQMEFLVPAIYDYYYLRITQPDGDRAVTAPVWLEGEAAVGIGDFSCATELPVQGKPIDLSVTLENALDTPLLVEKIEFFLEDELFHTTAAVTEVPGGESRSYDICPVLYALGESRITVAVTASLQGEPKRYEKTLSLSFRRDDTVTDLLVDCAHGNAAVERLGALEQLAGDNRVRLVRAEEEATDAQLAQAGILLITAPEAPFSQEFVQRAARFAIHGGTVILCGRSAELDGDIPSAEELNRILSAAGATLRLRADTAEDPVHNGGQSQWLYPVHMNTDAGWCRQISPDQVYRHISGCTLEPGESTWLVKGRETTLSGQGEPEPVLLAWEALSEGAVFAAGSLWLLEEELAPAKNIWDLPYANRTLAQTLLGAEPPQLPLKTVAQLSAGEICRIRGYVTAGTARPGNAFPDTLYLQDDTGGIAVIPFRQEGVALGTAVEVTGYLEEAGENRQFHPISHTLLSADAYRFEGKTGPYGELLDSEHNGGMLIQLEGRVERVQLAESGRLSQIILRDKKNQYATVLVEPYIVSGSTGENQLAWEVTEGQEVRALGIVHRHTDGSAVLRVRNCDEVIIIDPWPYTPDKIRDKTNPQSGDGILFWLGLTALSGAWLAGRKKWRPRDL